MQFISKTFNLKRYAQSIGKYHPVRADPFLEQPLYEVYIIKLWIYDKNNILAFDITGFDINHNGTWHLHPPIHFKDILDFI